MEAPAVIMETQRCKVMFENLDIPSRYFILHGDAPYRDLRSKVKNEFQHYNLSRKDFLLLWIDVDNDEILLDNDEALAAALSCVPVDQSGFRILRLLARHSSATGMPNNQMMAMVPESESEGNGKTESTARRTTTMKKSHTIALPNGPRIGKALEERSSDVADQAEAEEGEESFPCGLCGRTFTRKSSRTTHEKRFCHAQKGGAATVENGSGPSRSALKAESPPPFVDVAVVERVKQTTCDYCGQMFSRKDGRDKHMRKNTCGMKNSTVKNPAAQKSSTPSAEVKQDSSMENDATEYEAIQDSSLANPTKRAKRPSNDSNTARSSRSSTKRRRFSLTGSSKKKKSMDRGLCDPGCGKILSSNKNLKRHMASCEVAVARAIQNVE